MPPTLQSADFRFDHTILISDQRNRRITHNSIFAFSHSDFFVHRLTHLTVSSHQSQTFKGTMSFASVRRAALEAPHPHLAFNHPNHRAAQSRARINLTALAFVVNQKVLAFLLTEPKPLTSIHPVLLQPARLAFRRVLIFARLSFSSTGKFWLSGFRLTVLPASNSIRAGPHLTLTFVRQQTFLKFLSANFAPGSVGWCCFPCGRTTRFQRVHIVLLNRETSTRFFKFPCHACPSPQSRVFRVFLAKEALSSSGPHLNLEAKNVDRKTAFLVIRAARLFGSGGALGRLE